GQVQICQLPAHDPVNLVARRRFKGEAHAGLLSFASRGPTAMASGPRSASKGGNRPTTAGRGRYISTKPSKTGDMSPFSILPVPKERMEMRLNVVLTRGMLPIII